MRKVQGFGWRRRAVAFPSLVAVILGIGLAGCPDNGLRNPRWTGAFTNAISTCAGSHASFGIDPPREALIESRGEFRTGRSVELVYDGCSYFGEIAADGRLMAEMDPSCPDAEQIERDVGVMNVFSVRTTVYLWANNLDPNSCDVEAWGEFERE